MTVHRSARTHGPRSCVLASGRAGSPRRCSMRGSRSVSSFARPCGRCWMSSSCPSGAGFRPSRSRVPVFVCFVAVKSRSRLGCGSRQSSARSGWVNSRPRRRLANGFGGGPSMRLGVGFASESVFFTWYGPRRVLGSFRASSSGTSSRGLRSGSTCGGGPEHRNPARPCARRGAFPARVPFRARHRAGFQSATGGGRLARERVVRRRPVVRYLGLRCSALVRPMRGYTLASALVELVVGIAVKRGHDARCVLPPRAPAVLAHRER